jgi:hypothetical protein
MLHFRRLGHPKIDVLSEVEVGRDFGFTKGTQVGNSSCGAVPLGYHFGYFWRPGGLSGSPWERPGHEK